MSKKYNTNKSSSCLSSTTISSPLDIRVDALSHRYPRSDSLALDNIHLYIPSGTCFGLLGHNGAGKTTLISILAGIVKAQSGKISYHTGNAPAASAQRPRFSLIPQDYAFYPTLSGKQNLAFFAAMHRLNREHLNRQIERCIEIAGLQDVFDEQVKHYSGGFKRRLNIAIGLLNDPHILYLDEPTVGVDPRSRRAILNTIKDLNDSGMTVIYTSHYMEEVEYLCNQIAIIDRGKMVLNESKNQLLARSNDITIELVQPPSAEITVHLNKLFNDKISHGFDQQNGHTKIQVPATAEPSLSALIAKVESCGLCIHRIYPDTHRLEELYLSLTNHQ